LLNDTTLAIIAIVAALELLGLGVIETVNIQQQEAFAKGCRNSQAFNASKGRCFGHGP
jgi:hypothetical protein